VLLATGLSLPACFGCSNPGNSFPFDRTRDEFLAFVRFVQSEWSYEAHGPNDICQDPETSFAFQRGNCEDFAVMVAFFAQAHWHYDSMTQSHVVAFVQVDDQLAQQISDICTGVYPSCSLRGKKYVPVDFCLCPEWVWEQGPLCLCGKSEWYDMTVMRR
jgi:hypothetical protein